MSEDPARYGLTDIPPASRRIGDVARPASGWIRAVRDTLCLTLSDVARRLKVTPPAIRSFEQAEAEDRITLGSLRRTADAMNCDLIYALVPRQSEPAASISPVSVRESVPEKVTDLTWHAQRGES